MTRLNRHFSKAVLHDGFSRLGGKTLPPMLTGQQPSHLCFPLVFAMVSHQESAVTNQ